MENKYLEKISKLGPVGKGALIGAGFGSLLGYSGTERYDEKLHKVRDATTKERLTTAATLGTSFGVYGALRGHSKKIGDSNRRARGDYAKGGRTGNLSEHFKDMGASEIPKTKVEASKFYKRQAMKFHPDREGGSEEKMKHLNETWDKIKKHPDFEKMASQNRYLNVLL